MRAFLITLTLATGLAASAQVQSNQPEPQRPFPVPKLHFGATTTQVVPPITVQAPPFVFSTEKSSCPVSLFASRRGQPATIWTVSREDAADPGMQRRVMAGRAGSGLHVHLGPAHIIQMPGAILRAELAVDYLAPGPRLVPISTHTQPTTLSKTFSVRSGDVPSINLTADLLVGDTGGILRVRLLSIVLANGQTWTAPKPDDCTAIPSPYLPVNASHP